MGWYSVRLLFQSVINGKVLADSLCEQSIRLIRAKNEEEALKKAACIGKSGCHAYKNEQEEDISWEFERVLEVQDLCEDSITDGTEVFSLLFRKGKSAILE